MNITVRYENKSYDIHLGNGALKTMGEVADLHRKVMIVTDSGVPGEYVRTVAAQCREPHIFTFPRGEKSKNMDTFCHVLAQMLHAGFTRSDCVVAVGGGVVGDLSGFAASCYMRGVDFYNVPTTLLSQVDSSIGGKTAVDFEGIKNAVGAFYPPKAVFIDPLTLQTLDRRQVSAGLTEAIKMAATSDAALFEKIEKSTDLQKDLPDIIYGALRIKKMVVEEDPKEQGLRKVLNFGHTAGHAVESFCGGELLHGECVAIGMLPMCSAPVQERLENLLTKYGLPVRFKADVQKLLPIMMHDKKMQNGLVQTVFVPQIGSFSFRQMTPQEILTRMENAG